MDFGVVVPVVGGGVAKREKERERGKVAEIRDKGKEENFILFFYYIIYIILMSRMKK